MARKSARKSARLLQRPPRRLALMAVAVGLLAREPAPGVLPPDREPGVDPAIQENAGAPYKALTNDDYP